jgi:hypothetical protein
MEALQLQIRVNQTNQVREMTMGISQINGQPNQRTPFYFENFQIQDGVFLILK